MDSALLLEVVERSAHTTGADEPAHKMYQAYKGQLRISVYISAGVLTVEVQEARDLSAPGALRPYVKVALQPESRRRPARRTSVQSDTSAPCWHQHFSFGLSADDQRKRVHVAVWNQHPGIARSEFLGCMSFGLHYMGFNRRIADGWYFLLAAQLGNYKHLKVNQGSRSTTKYQESLIQDESSNFDTRWQHGVKVSLRSGRRGYGVCLSGSCPVRITKVKPGSPAEGAGVLAGDQIEAVNGRRVTCWTADGVARLLRHLSDSEEMQVLTLSRPHCDPSPDHSDIWRTHLDLPRRHDDATSFLSVNSWSEESDGSVNSVSTSCRHDNTSNLLSDSEGSEESDGSVYSVSMSRCHDSTTKTPNMLSFWDFL